MSYKLVEDLQKKACPKVAVSQACRVFEVIRSGYYANVAVFSNSALLSQLCALPASPLKAAFAASAGVQVILDKLQDYITDAVSQVEQVGCCRFCGH